MYFFILPILKVPTQSWPGLDWTRLDGFTWNFSDLSHYIRTHSFSSLFLSVFYYFSTFPSPALNLKRLSVSTYIVHGIWSIYAHLLLINYTVLLYNSRTAERDVINSNYSSSCSMLTFAFVLPFWILDNAHEQFKWVKWG